MYLVCQRVDKLAGCILKELDLRTQIVLVSALVADDVIDILLLGVCEPF